MLGQDGKSCKDIVVASSISVKDIVAWKEAKNDDGSSYFWNIQTNGGYNVYFVIIKIHLTYMFCKTIK